MIDDDFFCPECGYNLRGLTVPRCPECGHRFEWSDLPYLRRPCRSDIERVLGVGLVALVALTIAAIALLTGTALLGVSIALLERAEWPYTWLAVFFMVTSLVQAVFELGVANLFIRPFSKLRFGTWWQGVFIGYAPCIATYVLAERMFDPRSAPGTWGAALFQLGLVTVIVAEAFVSQWWVLRKRLRQWGDAVPPKRLLRTCLAAKLLVALPWLLVARYFNPF